MDRGDRGLSGLRSPWRPGRWRRGRGTWSGGADTGIGGDRSPGEVVKRPVQHDDNQSSGARG